MKPSKHELQLMGAHSSHHEYLPQQHDKLNALSTLSTKPVLFFSMSRGVT